MTRHALLILTFAAACGPALAETAVDRTVPFTGRSVSIEMISGELTIEGSSGKDVEIKGVLRHRCEEMEVETTSEGVAIEVDWVCSGSTKGDHHGGSHLTVRLPHGADLNVETISAPVAVSGVEGDLDVETISGTINIRAASRSIDLASVSGTIELISAAPLNDANLETVSGTIDAEIDPASGGTIDIESVSGSVVVKLASGASASLDATSFSGKITNGLSSEQAVKTSQYLPSSELSFKLGGGGARINIETLSGRIDIRGR